MSIWTPSPKADLVARVRKRLRLIRSPRVAEGRFSFLAFGEAPSSMISSKNSIGFGGCLIEEKAKSQVFEV